MRVPFKWLKKYVDFNQTPEEIADLLTFAGLEVESIEDVADDKILVMEITPNRPDCMSIIGIAREIAAITGGKIKPLKVKLKSDGLMEECNVKVIDIENCIRYVGIVLRDVKIEPSPQWMQTRLIQCGLRPINNVVDITNYVLLETGQPMHAFDLDLIGNKTITVRQAEKGETIVTIDGVKRELDKGMLVIADVSVPLALAGIMGGKDTEISSSTRNVFLESACFNPPCIRRTSKRLGIVTESSMRFERGVDFDMVRTAAEYAGALILNIAEAKEIKIIADIYEKSRVMPEVKCRYSAINELLGVNVSKREVKRIFKSLGFKILSEDRSGVTCRVPSYRLDISMEEDLIEEVARIYGLDKIPDNEPTVSVIFDADDSPIRLVFKIKDTLTKFGLTEIMHVSWLSENLLKLCNLYDHRELIYIMNPNSTVCGPLRPSLVPQMIESLANNYQRHFYQQGIFEMGRIFKKGPDSGNFIEKTVCCIGIIGPVLYGNNGIRMKISKEETFLNLKGIIEGLGAIYNCDIEFKKTEVTFMEHGWCAELFINGEKAGILGIVEPTIMEHKRVKVPCGIAEFEIQSIIKSIKKKDKVEMPSLYPPVFRDFAIIVSESVSHKDVVDTIKRFAPKELTEIKLFDIFRNEEIGNGLKSLAYSLVYRSDTRTLTDEEVNEVHNNLVTRVALELKGQVRGLS